MPDNSHQQELDLLLQKEWREQVVPNLGAGQWIRVYQSPFDPEERQACLYCGLVPNKSVEKVLNTYDWDIRIGDFAPTILEIERDLAAERAWHYDRYGGKQYGIEPLIIVRNFDGLRDSALEISEEFRVFHNLYHEQRESTFVKFDDIGDAIPVVRISECCVEISRRHIRQFLAAKDMSLAIYFERMCFSTATLEQLSITEEDLDFVSKKCVYRMSLINRDRWLHREERSQSWILGKTIIEGLPIEKCGLWPFEEEVEREYAEFIIYVDSDDEPILFTSNPDKLANYFGENPDAPQYVTPVYFQRKVLEKYYNEPSKYSVEDGHVWCDGLWGLRLDNNHPDYVIVLLGDLGRDLPTKEQAHWKHHNVVPDGTPSCTATKRWYLGEFADPEDTALILQQSFNLFQKAWREKHNWHLFKPLSEADVYHFSQLRRPLTKETSEFHEIVLSLSILLQDRIDKKELGKLIPEFEPKNADKAKKGNIPVLGEYLESQGFTDSEKHIEYLRMLQLLRSNSGAVHPRNEKEYQKAVKFFSLDSKSTTQVADDIFTTLSDFLDSLRAHFCEDEVD